VEAGAGSGSSGTVKFLWKRKHFEERSWKRSELGSIWLFEEPEAEAFFKKHGVSTSSNLATIFGIKYNKKDS